MLLVAGLLAMLAPADALAKRAIVLRIDGAIGPAVAEYIVRELHAANPSDTGPGFKQPAHRNLRVSEGVKNLLR